MKSRTLPVVILIFALLTIPSVAQAREISGTKCAKKGATTNFAGVRYQCTKTSKGLAWTKAGTSSKQTSAASPTSGRLKQAISVPQLKKVEITAGKVSGSFSSSSKLPVEVRTSTPTICAVQDSTILIMQTGTCLITANQEGSAEYLPAPPVTFTLEITPPTITSDNALFDEVQTFIRVPKGTTYSSDTAEIVLTAVTNDATAKVCADDATALGCTSLNGSGVADPSSETRYVEFVFHVKNLDANALPPVSYRLLLNGELTDIDTEVSLQTLNNLVIETNASTDASFYGLVPKSLNLAGAYLVIDQGITDPSIVLLLDLSN